MSSSKIDHGEPDGNALGEAHDAVDALRLEALGEAEDIRATRSFWRELPVLVTEAISLKRGDIFFHVTPSGGGFGEPFERDPASVLEDVVEEKLSPERARAAYGVVIQGSPPRVDKAATREIRSSGGRAARDAAGESSPPTP